MQPPRQKLLKNKKQTVWIIDRDWKGYFYALEVNKEETEGIDIRTFKTKKAALKAIQDIWIDQSYQ